MRGKTGSEKIKFARICMISEHIYDAVNRRCMTIGTYIFLHTAQLLVVNYTVNLFWLLWIQVAQHNVRRKEWEFEYQQGRREHVWSNENQTQFRDTEQWMTLRITSTRPRLKIEYGTQKVPSSTTNVSSSLARSPSIKVVIRPSIWGWFLLA